VSNPWTTAQKYRRLEELGFKLEVTAAGKHYWREPETQHLVSEPHAMELLSEREERHLREAEWEPVEVEGQRYWRRPDTGRLYSQGAAYDVLRTLEESQ
jgi:hypothetical protein